MNKNKIPEELFRQILEELLICCVDIIIECNGKVLLLKRDKEPEKNKWWIVGGRVLKNEKLEQAIIRKAKEETGLDVKIKKQIGVYEYVSDKSIFSRIGTHSIVVVYLVSCKENPEVKIDLTSSDYKWIDKIEEGLDFYVQKVLKDSGVFD